MAPSCKGSWIFWEPLNVLDFSFWKNGPTQGVLQKGQIKWSPTDRVVHDPSRTITRGHHTNLRSLIKNVMMKRRREMKPIKGEKRLERLSELRKSIREVRLWKQVKAIWLKESLGWSRKEIAMVLGDQIQTVYSLWHRWKREGIKMFENRISPGGRRHASLSEEEEREWLNCLKGTSESGERVTVAQIQSTYEVRVGRTVAPSTVYRALKRHGWRKVVPRSHHPKMVPEKLEEAQKNSVVKPRPWSTNSTVTGTESADSVDVHG